MFTRAQAREAIDNAAYFARGEGYAHSGRVGKIEVDEDELVTTYSAMVQGSFGQRYHVEITYDEELEDFISCECDCPAFERAYFGCKHVAALMIAVCEGQGGAKNADKAHRKAEEAELALIREECRQQFIDRLTAKASVGRRGMSQEDPACLYPVLGLDKGRVSLEMKVGRTRAYVIRSFAEFARRMERHERAFYGRELTLTHCEEAFAPEEAPLLRHLLLLEDSVPHDGAGKMILRGAALDQTMRLLLGRKVELREARGLRVPVMEGLRKPEIELTQKADGALLSVEMEKTARGIAGIYFFDQDAIRCTYGTAARRLDALMEIAESYPGGMEMNEPQLDAMCAQVLAPAAEYMLLRKGSQLLYEHSPTQGTPRFYIDIKEDSLLTCGVRMDYCGTETLPGRAQPPVRIDAALEAAALEAAEHLFPRRLEEGEYAFEGNDEACFELLNARIGALESLGEVMISERLSRINVQKSRSMSFGVSVSGTELLLKADLGGFTQEELKEAYTAYRKKRRFVRLKSGMFLSGEALEQAADAAQVLDSLDMTAQEAEAGKEIPKARAMYLDAALEKRENMKLNAPKALTDWISRLREAQKIRAAQPQGLRAELREYQLTGLSFMSALSESGFGGILADDMGLGKTLQTLALLLREQEKGNRVRALVVCPASLQLNWHAEAERFAPSLTCGVMKGTGTQRARQLGESADTQLLITSYDQLRRDVRQYEGIEWTHVILDEAQSIKNAASQAAKAVKVLKAEHRFALTGTPIENRLSELWSIFDFLLPGYLLTYKKFKERFEMPVVHDADEEARNNLRRMVAPFILRRMKREVLADLPEKVETIMTSEMTPEQQRLYAAHAAQLMEQADGGLAEATDRMRILAGLTRLRQICCDPRLCLEGYQGGSGKLEQCVDVVKNTLAAGHRILLFSQFTSMLALLQEAFEAEGIAIFMLTGQTDKQERMRLVEAFNAGDAQVFLISLKAGGTGLNLTGADVVIHYDPWWNTAAQNQATDRAYRIGQTRGVQVIRMIAADTIEERILTLQEKKRELSEGMLEGTEDLFTVNTETLREILKA